MRALSLFSGAGGFEVGLHAAGIETVAMAEIDPGACRILSRRFPDIPNLGSVTDVTDEQAAGLDVALVVGGFPCQDLSIAGRRKGIEEGERSSLWFEMLRIFDASGATWLLAENVPGLLSGSDDEDEDEEDDGVPGEGRLGDGPSGSFRSWFGTLLRSLDDRGLDVSWCVLDARHFGVPQRRRRVFILARRPGDGPHPKEVLAVCEGMQRDPATSDEARSLAAGGSREGAEGGGDHVFVKRGRPQTSDDPERWAEGEVTPTLNSFDVGDGRATTVVTASDSGRGWWKEEGEPSLRASGGDHGGGSEAMVAENVLIPEGHPDPAYALADSTGGRTGTGRDAQDTFVVTGRPFISSPVDGNKSLSVKDADAAATLRANPSSTSTGGDQGTFVLMPEAGQGADLMAKPTDEATSVLSGYAKSTDRGTFVVGPLMAHSKDHGHAMSTQQAADAGHFVVNGDPTPKVAVDEALTLRANQGSGGRQAVVAGAVRRLTPVECERLMGWPPGWTCTCDTGTIPGPVPQWKGWDHCACTDSARYRACGNGVASPCAEWIGRRLIELTGGNP